MEEKINQLRAVLTSGIDRFLERGGKLIQRRWGYNLGEGESKIHCRCALNAAMEDAFDFIRCTTFGITWKLKNQHNLKFQENEIVSFLEGYDGKECDASSDTEEALWQLGVEIRQKYQDQIYHD